MSLQELRELVDSFGLRYIAQRLGLTAGTVSTYLIIPQREARLTQLRNLIFPTPIDIQERSRLQAVLRIRPSATQLQAIHTLHQELFPRIVPVLYNIIRFAWYLDYAKGGFTTTPEGNRGKYDLHVRLVLTGTIKPDKINTDKLKEQMREAARATAVYVPRKDNGVDDLLYTMYNADENNGYYGVIETLGTVSQYNPLWEVYGFFKNLTYNKQYEWSFHWTIREEYW